MNHEGTAQAKGTKYKLFVLRALPCSFVPFVVAKLSASGRSRRRTGVGGRAVLRGRGGPAAGLVKRKGPEAASVHAEAGAGGPVPVSEHDVGRAVGRDAQHGSGASGGVGKDQRPA